MTSDVWIVFIPSEPLPRSKSPIRLSVRIRQHGRIRNAPISRAFRHSASQHLHASRTLFLAELQVSPQFRPNRDPSFEVPADIVTWDGSEHCYAAEDGLPGRGSLWRARCTLLSNSLHLQDIHKLAHKILLVPAARNRGRKRRINTFMKADELCKVGREMDEKVFLMLQVHERLFVYNSAESDPDPEFLEFPPPMNKVKCLQTLFLTPFTPNRLLQTR